MADLRFHFNNFTKQCTRYKITQNCANISNSIWLPGNLVEKNRLLFRYSGYIYFQDNK